jgi:hypothetical protein
VGGDLNQEDLEVVYGFAYDDEMTDLSYRIKYKCFFG